MKALLRYKATLQCIGILCSIATLFACTTAPTEPKGEDARDTYDTRSADVYTYESNSGLSGRDVQSSSGTGAAGGPGTTAAERTIYFDFDSAEIRSDARPTVEAHARYLIGNPGTATVLEGHADEQGTREYNIGLGERRSDAVRRLLRAYGVAPQQIRVVSYGEEKPAAAGQNDSSYARNRRVEIVY